MRAPARPTLETYQPDRALIEGLGRERPDLDLPVVIDNWRDYHRERGTAIKDFNASLRRWVRTEKPPARASPAGPAGRNGRLHGDEAAAEAIRLLRGQGAGGPIEAEYTVRRG